MSSVLKSMDRFGSAFLPTRSAISHLNEMIESLGLVLYLLKIGDKLYEANLLALMRDMFPKGVYTAHQTPCRQAASADSQRALDD